MCIRDSFKTIQQNLQDMRDKTKPLDVSSLNIDTSDNTLIVLMGNDNSPIPFFG